MGRPTKGTDPRRELVLEALRQGHTRRAAAGYAKVNRVTLFRWIDKDATFRDAVEQAEDEAENRIASVLIAGAVEENDWKAALEWLQRRRNEDWKKSEERQNTGKDGETLKVIIVPEQDGV